VRDDDRRAERRAEPRTDYSGDDPSAAADSRPHHEATGHEREERRPTGDGASGATGTNPVRENTPRTDNQSGPTT
jgi:hypothetical protein